MISPPWKPQRLVGIRWFVRQEVLWFGLWAELATEPKLRQSVGQEAAIAISDYMIARVRMHGCRRVNCRAKLCPGSGDPVVLFYF